MNAHALLVAVVAVALIAPALCVGAVPVRAAVEPNPIVAENAKPGTGGWEGPEADPPPIEGRVALSAVVAAAILAATPAAEASFPGRNGLLVFVSNRAPSAQADRDGDLYTVHPSGKGLRALTANQVFELSPRWSPAGKRIVLSRFAPTGSLCVMRADGTGVRRITAPRGMNDVSPSWSPSGRRIAFVRQPARPRAYLAGEVFVVNSDGTGLRRVPLLRGEYSGLTWSPDGTRFAYLRQQELYVVRADGSDLRRLLPSTAGIQGFSWSPDGKRIAAAVDLYPTHAILAANVDGSDEDVLVPDVRAADPAWSPDGKKIAFRTTDLRIAVADIASGRVRVVSGGPPGTADSQPDWQSRP